MTRLDPERKPPRRIVHCSSAHGANDSRILWRECRSLAESGDDVTIVAPAEEDVEIGGVAIRAIRPAESRFERVTRTAWTVLWVARGLRGDVYHMHDPELLPLNWIVRRKGTVVIYDAHEDLPRQVYHKPWIPSWARGLARRLATLLLLVGSWMVDGVVAATPHVAETFADRLPIAVIHNFPRVSEFDPDQRINSDPPLVVYVGVIAEARGAIEMVEAIDRVNSQLGVRLVLAGSITPTSLMPRLESMSGWSKTQFLGRIDPHEIPRLLLSARVGLVLLKDHPAYRQPYATKMFEYMAAGMPFVASSLPAWRQQLEPWGCSLSVDPDDPEAIAEAIQWLLEHPHEADAMGRRGRDVVIANFSWETEEQNLLRFYSSLLTG